MKPKKGDFWIFNISKKDIYLSDLRIKIPKGKHLNLLSGNNPYTQDDLEISLKSGSIATKSQYLKISRVKPVFNYPKPEPLPTEIRMGQLRSSIQDTDELLPELELLNNLIPDDEDEEDITERNDK